MILGLFNDDLRFQVNEQAWILAEKFQERVFGKD
jgi:hypothetical protein